jgi:hypothetical protein
MKLAQLGEYTKGKGYVPDGLLRKTGGKLGKFLMVSIAEHCANRCLVLHTVFTHARTYRLALWDIVGDYRSHERPPTYSPALTIAPSPPAIAYVTMQASLRVEDGAQLSTA